MVTLLKQRVQQQGARLIHKAARERMRGSKWMALRELVLRANPLCVHCQIAGRLAAATEVDHRTPLHLGGMDDPANLQGLCHDCHTAKSASEGMARAGLSGPIATPTRTRQDDL